jgi:hypothetical protein
METIHGWLDMLDAHEERCFITITQVTMRIVAAGGADGVQVAYFWLE